MRRQSDRLTIIERHWLWQDSLYMQKRDPNIIDCNFGKDSRILMIFGTSISKATGHQMAIQFPTSPNICFYNTWGKQNKRNMHWNEQQTSTNWRLDRIKIWSRWILRERCELPQRGLGRSPMPPKSNLVHFSLKIWHLVATILIIFLRINWSNLVQYTAV